MTLILVTLSGLLWFACLVIVDLLDSRSLARKQMRDAEERHARLKSALACEDEPRGRFDCLREG